MRVRYSRHELYELAYRSRVEIQLSHSERVRRSDFDWGCGHGSSDGERAHAQLDSAVEACLAAQDSVTRSVSSTDSADRHVVASAGSFRLRACAGSVKLFSSAFGSARIAPHIHPHIVRHWFGTVKNFRRVDQLLSTFLAPCSPVCVARRGNLTAEAAYGNQPSVAPHALLFNKLRYVPTLCTVGLWCFNLVPRPIFRVYVFRRWPSSLSQSFASFTI